MLFRQRSDTFFYGRQKRRVPRWLLLLLLGTGAGAGSVLYVQERVLPPRLSMDASTQLRTAFEQAEAERTRLATELSQASGRLESANAERQRLSGELASQRAAAERLRGDLATVVAALPPDPRNGAVEVRAARFSAQAGSLAYDVVLTRDTKASRPLAGVMQLVVTGEAAGNGAAQKETSVSLQPIALSIGRQEVLRGTLPLPEGFRPQATTVRILDRSEGRLLGMRMLVVK